MKYAHRPALLAALFAAALSSAQAQTWLEPGDRFTRRDGPSDSDAFARGKLGVVLPSYGHASLFAAYRVLMLPPQALASESHERLKPATTDRREAKVQWLDARAAVRQDAPRPIDYYKNFGSGLQGVFGNCGGNAFETAAKTLADLRANPAVKPPEIQSWIDGQDAVFDQCAWSPDKGTAPPLPAGLPSDASPTLRALRQYQHAAALFYRGDFDVARSEFDAIAADEHHPMRALAALASLRCMVRAATLDLEWNLAFQHAYLDQGLRDDALNAALARAGAHKRDHGAQAETKIEERAAPLLKDPQFAAIQPAVRKEVEFAATQLTPSRMMGALFGQLDHLDHNPYPEDTLTRWSKLYLSTIPRGFSGPAADNLRTAHPFFDWQMTIGGCDDDPRDGATDTRCATEHAHALARWQADKNTAWLVAALATLRHPGDADRAAIDAARKVPADDAAWATLHYHAIRALRLQGRRDEARQLADDALTHTGLDPATANLFHQERFALARDLPSALPDAMRTLDTKAPATLAADGGELFDGRLASDDLLALARDDKTPAPLRANFAAAAWFRADLAQRFDVATQAAALAGTLTPRLDPAARRYAGATTPDDRHDVIVQTALTTQFAPVAYHESRFRLGEPLPRLRSPASDWCAFGGAERAHQRAVERSPELSPELHAGAAQSEELAHLQAVGDGPAWFAHQAIATARRHPGDPVSVRLLQAVVRGTQSGDSLCPAADNAALRAQAQQLLSQR